MLRSPTALLVAATAAAAPLVAGAEEVPAIGRVGTGSADPVLAPHAAAVGPRAFLDTYCVRCHGPEGPRADVRLDAGALGPDPLAALEAGADEDALDAWDWILEQVELEFMPPPGEPEPGAELRAAFVGEVRGALARAQGDPAALPLPRTPLRRLTRAEYEHALRDLFGIEHAASGLPEDAVGHGFDHVGEAQSLSEQDFVRYLDAAERAAERIVGVRRDPARVVRADAAQIRADRSRDDGAWLFSNRTAWGRLSIPRGGVYEVRAEVFAHQAGDEPARARLHFDGGARSDAFDVPFERDAPGVIRAELTAPAGGDVRVGVRFTNDYYLPATEDAPAIDRNLAIRWIEVRGPLDDAPLGAFAAEMAGGEGAGPLRAERALRRGLVELARRVWRDPALVARDVDALLALTERAQPPDERLRAAVAGLLVSPRFLFRAEEGRGPLDARSSRSLTSVETATRLAAFLWQSVPDPALLERASRVDLSRESQAVRCALDMLGDPRSEAFVDSFGAQWLQLRGASLARDGVDGAPGIDRAEAARMLEETHRVLLDSLRERRSLWDLVDGASSVIDAALAERYGVDFPAEAAGADGWARVSLEGTPRRGLLGHASVLVHTSEPGRTSPVLRGKWVLEALLDSAPPPPPPGADSLAPSDETKDLSFREQLELHRADVACAACHQRMDPIGFGLESFGPLGEVRDAVDATGVLPDGRAFDGPLELIAVLREDDRFLDAFVARLATYALGRGLERADRAFLDGVRAGLDPEHPTFERAVLGVVASQTFRRVRVD
ncbi:MAG: DUF1588 domain-containing protein [Planctomycetota bacterium]